MTHGDRQARLCPAMHQRCKPCHFLLVIPLSLVHIRRHTPQCSFPLPRALQCGAGSPRSSSLKSTGCSHSSFVSCYLSLEFWATLSAANHLIGSSVHPPIWSPTLSPICASKVLQTCYGYSALVEDTETQIALHRTFPRWLSIACLQHGGTQATSRAHQHACSMAVRIPNCTTWRRREWRILSSPSLVGEARSAL